MFVCVYGERDKRKGGVKIEMEQRSVNTYIKVHELKYISPQNETNITFTNGGSPGAGLR